MNKAKNQNSTRACGASINADIGDQGELWFAAELPRGWVWQPPRRDLGKDGLIVVRDNSHLHNLEFAVQIKSSVEPKVRDGQMVISGVSRSSVQYWFASPLPTLVVIVDVTRRVGWFAWHLDLFSEPADVFDGNADTLTLRIPEKNRLDDDGSNQIRRHLNDHFLSLQLALTDQRVSSKLIATVHCIVTATANLVRISGTPPPRGQPTEEEGWSLAVEQASHRDVLLTVRLLLDRINPDSSVTKSLQFWAESYETIVLEAFPRLSNMPEEGWFHDGLEIAFAPKRLAENRSKLITSSLDMLRMLTNPNAGKEAEQGAALDGDSATLHPRQ